MIPASLLRAIGLKGLGLIALLIMLGVQTTRLHHRTSQRDALRSDLVQAKAVRDHWQNQLAETETAMRLAQQTATRLAVDAAKAEETRTRKISDDIQSQVAARIAAVRSADSGRVRHTIPPAAGHSDGNADLPRATNSAPGLDGAGSEAVMDDRDRSICTINTILAEGWRDYAERLSVPDAPIIGESE